MDIFKSVVGWWKEEHSANWYLYNCENSFEAITFLFVGSCGWITISFGWLLLFLTAPVWVIPYLLYNHRKYTNEKK